MQNMMRGIVLALIVFVVPASARAFQDQWQPSSRSLAEYVADGYVMAQPVVRLDLPRKSGEFPTKDEELRDAKETIYERV